MPPFNQPAREFWTEDNEQGKFFNQTGTTMKYSLNLYAFIALAALSVVMANPQTGSNATKHYVTDFLAFDYPEDWAPTESSSQGVQTVTLARHGSVSQVVVSTQHGLTPTGDNAPVRTGITAVPDPCDFQAQRKRIADDLTKKLAAQINARVPPSSLPVTTQIGGADFEGARLQGVLNHTAVTGTVYSTRLNRRFVSLVFILAANDERAKSAWNTVRTSLTVNPGVLTALGTKVVEGSEAPIAAGVMNGRALALPKPDYPKIARSAHAAGTVTVQVTIDETGNVISAHAVGGHPLLQASCVAAAKEARFSPTKLCGEPARVTGVITYNFVAQ
jgi:TonB family protein